jgi:hypothetical protein
MRDGDHPETLGDGAEVQLQRAELVGEWRVVGQQGASAAPPRRLEHGGRLVEELLLVLLPKNLML